MELVVAVAEGQSEEDKADHGKDGSSIKKHFTIKQEALVIVTKFDGDNFAITFKRVVAN